MDEWFLRWLIKLRLRFILVSRVEYPIEFYHHCAYRLLPVRSVWRWMELFRRQWTQGIFSVPVGSLFLWTMAAAYPPISELRAEHVNALPYSHAKVSCKVLDVEILTLTMVRFALLVHGIVVIITPQSAKVSTWKTFSIQLTDFGKRQLSSMGNSSANARSGLCDIC